MSQQITKFSEWDGQTPLFNCPPKGRVAYEVNTADGLVAYGWSKLEKRLVFQLDVSRAEQDRFNAEMARENATIEQGLPPFGDPVADGAPNDPGNGTPGATGTQTQTQTQSQ